MWIAKLAFLSDIFEPLNELNIDIIMWKKSVHN
jgi:hypothetical protein